MATVANDDGTVLADADAVDCVVATVSASSSEAASVVGAVAEEGGGIPPVAGTFAGCEAFAPVLLRNPELWTLVRLVLEVPQFFLLPLLHRSAHLIDFFFALVRRGVPGKSKSFAPSRSRTLASRTPHPECPSDPVNNDGRLTPSTSTSLKYLYNKVCKVLPSNDMAADLINVDMMMVCCVGRVALWGEDSAVRFLVELWCLACLFRQDSLRFDQAGASDNRSKQQEGNVKLAGGCSASCSRGQEEGAEAKNTPGACSGTFSLAEVVEKVAGQERVRV